MPISKLQVNQILNSGGTATPPSSATYLVACFSHTGSNHTAGPGTVQWDGTGMASRIYKDGPAAWSANAIYILDRPDVSGLAALTWTNAGWDAFLYWLRYVDHISPVLATGHVSGAPDDYIDIVVGGSPTTNDFLMYAAAKDTTGAGWSLATSDDTHNMGGGSIGFASEWGSGGASDYGRFGSAGDASMCGAGIAIKYAREGGASQAIWMMIERAKKFYEDLKLGLIPPQDLLRRHREVYI